MVPRNSNSITLKYHKLTNSLETGRLRCKYKDGGKEVYISMSKMWFKGACDSTK